VNDGGEKMLQRAQKVWCFSERKTVMVRFDKDVKDGLVEMICFCVLFVCYSRKMIDERKHALA